MRWGNYLFSFRGRINRAKMWLFYVVVWAFEMAVFLSLLLVYTLLFAAGVVDKNAAPDSQSPVLGIAACIVIGLFLVTIYYAYLAVMAKRLHDRDRSAWWVLVFFLLPVVLVFAPAVFSSMESGRNLSNTDSAMAIPFLLVGFALYFWGFVEIYCLHGTVGDNHYGPDPLPPKMPASR